MNIQGTQATIDPKLIMNTNNMADQNTFTHGNTQDENGGGDVQHKPTNEELDAYILANIDLEDVPAVDLFPDMQQGQPMQSLSSILPLNTKGPYYDPEIQWHVKSTLGIAAPLPPPTDPNYTGPFYAPEVGWYYKMINGPGAQQVAPNPYAMPQEGYTPAPVMPSGMTTPRAPVDYMPAVTTFTPGVDPIVPHMKPTRKPKYGPAAYLSKNAGGSVTTPPRTVSVSEAHYTSAARRRGTRTDTVPTFDGSRKRKQLSIVQTCICAERRGKKVKRPANAFILYRSSRKDQIMKSLDTRNNQNVSKAAAEMWKNESNAVKKQFHDLALKEAARHKEEHPDYKYQPGLAERTKFGSASCTCGAYEINMNALVAKRANGSFVDYADDEDEVGEDSDAYVPPRSNRNPGKQPQMLMAPPTMQAPPLDPSPFGYAPWQQGQAAPDINQPRRKRGADQVLEQAGDEDEGNDPPLAKRLLTSPNISYAEVDDTEIEEDIYADPGLQHQPGTYPMPNPLNSPPAANTRAQSRARNSLSPPSHGMELDFETIGNHIEGFDDDANMLFGDSTMAPRPGTSGSQDSQSHPYSLRPRGASKSPPRQ